MMSVVLADAGTPLIFGSAIHVLVGNLIVGCFEAWLLVLVMDTRTADFGLLAYGTSPLVLPEVTGTRAP